MKWPPPDTALAGKSQRRHHYAARAARDALLCRALLRRALPAGISAPEPGQHVPEGELARLWAGGERRPLAEETLAVAASAKGEGDPRLAQLLAAAQAGAPAPASAPVTTAAAAAPRDDRDAAARALREAAVRARAEAREFRATLALRDAELQRARREAEVALRAKEEAERRDRDARIALHEAEALRVERDRLAAEVRALRPLEASLVAARAAAAAAERQRDDAQAAADAARHHAEELQRKLAEGPPKKPRPARDQERVGIYVDVSNIYYGSTQALGGTVDYGRMREVAEQGRKLVRAAAYLVDSEDNPNQGFKAAVKEHGFQIVGRRLVRRGDGTARGDWDMGMALAILGDIDRLALDTVVIASGDGDFTDLVVHLKHQGVRVEIIGVPGSLAHTLAKVADAVIEIDRSWVYRDRPDRLARRP